MTVKNNNIPTNTNNRLSVQVTLTGLSFLVTNASNENTIFFIEKKFSSEYTPEELLLEIKTVFDQQEALGGAFEEVSIIYSNSVYTLVPSSLFEENKLSDYLKFNTKLLSNDFIAYDLVRNHDIVVVYVPYVNINNYMFDRFGSFQYYHSACILLKNIMDNEKHSQLPKAYINVNDAQFDLIVLNDGKLQLCNTYSYKTPEDFIYYVLFSFEQLKLNPETLDVVLFGEIEIDDSIYEILYRYIRNVSFINSENVIVSGDTNENDYRHYLLKNVYQ